APARFERRREFVAVAMAEVLDGVGDAAHRAVGPHVVETDGEKGHRLVGGTFELDLGGADDLDRLGQDAGVEGERALIVARLVAREIRAEPDDAEFTAVEAGGLRRAHGKAARPAWSGAQPLAGQVKRVALDALARPEAVGPPAPRPLFRETVGLDRVEHVIA